MSVLLCCVNETCLAVEHISVVGNRKNDTTDTMRSVTTSFTASLFYFTFFTNTHATNKAVFSWQGQLNKISYIKWKAQVISLQETTLFY